LVAFLLSGFVKVVEVFEGKVLGLFEIALVLVIEGGVVGVGWGGGLGNVRDGFVQYEGW
jgi:hypothetical protein